MYCTNISLLLGSLNRFWIYPLSDSSGTTTPAFLKAPLTAPHNREKFDKKQQLKNVSLEFCVSEYVLYPRIGCAFNENLIWFFCKPVFFKILFFLEWNKAIILTMSSHFDVNCYKILINICPKTAEFYLSYRTTCFGHSLVGSVGQKMWRKVHLRCLIWSESASTYCD